MIELGRLAEKYNWANKSQPAKLIAAEDNRFHSSGVVRRKLEEAHIAWEIWFEKHWDDWMDDAHAAWEAAGGNEDNRDWDD